MTSARSCAFKIANRATVHQSINRTHAINDQNAIKMVVLMLPHASEESIALERKLIAVNIHRSDDRMRRSHDLAANVRQTQAAFVVQITRATEHETRIDKRALRLTIVSKYDEHAKTLPQLRRCDPDTFMLLRISKEIFDQFFDERVDPFNGARFHAQDGVGMQDKAARSRHFGMVSGERLPQRHQDVRSLDRSIADFSKHPY
jgi:hypothetical protein